jgi:hypothetical protein
LNSSLIAGDLAAAFAWRDGVAISRRRFAADARALAERLPAAGTMLNLSTDRYRFAVGLGAALLRGQSSLLPPNHLANTVARLRTRFTDAYALVETGGDGHGLPAVEHRHRRRSTKGDASAASTRPPSPPTSSPPTCSPRARPAIRCRTPSRGACS